jgi:hypothetical protein
MRLALCVVGIAIITALAAALFFGDKHVPPVVITSAASSRPLAVVATNTATTTKTTAKKILWGAYIGADDTALAPFEALAEAPVDLQAVFVGWGDNGGFPVWVDSLAGSGKTLVIFWEPSNGNSDIVVQPDYNYDSILNGSWNSYLASFAAEAKAYGGPIIVVPFEEMNGNWYPWSGTSNGNTPAKMIAAFRYVHSYFSGVSNVRFGWAPNAVSEPDTPANAIAAYYPGDAYVDYVGLDGFNFGGENEQSFEQVFGNALFELSQYQKPVYIFSMATAEEPTKAAWITDALAVQIPHDDIAGWIWFNQDKEQQWAIDSDLAALAAFRAAVR